MNEEQEYQDITETGIGGLSGIPSLSRQNSQ